MIVWHITVLFLILLIFNWTGDIKINNCNLCVWWQNPRHREKYKTKIRPWVTHHSKRTWPQLPLYKQRSLLLLSGHTMGRVLCPLYIIKALSKQPLMAKTCSVFTVVYLPFSSGCSLISDWERVTSSSQSPAAFCHGCETKEEWGRGAKEQRGVEGGKLGGTETGSGCNFLRKLSEPFLVQSIWTSKGRREEGKGVSTKKRTKLSRGR